jgi:alanine-synthesizing transaminase
LDQEKEDRRVRFSQRLKWDARPNALSRERHAVELSGRRLVDLTISNPTQAGIPYPPDLLTSLADPRALSYTPDAAGIRDTREAVAEYYAGHGASIHPDRIILTASTSEAYHYLFKLTSDPGDEILVPHPSYPLFDYLAGLELLSTIPYPISSDDPCNLATERTRALVAVHPNNPTGDVLTPPARHLLPSRCSALEMALIVDEVFLDYPLDSPAPTMALTGPAFVLSGLSKICGLPQMKLGWIVLAGDHHPEVRQRLELIADTYLSVSAPVQWAAIGWLRRRHEFQAPILDRIRHNSHLLREILEGSGLSFRPPQGGWTTVIELPSTIDEEVLVLRMLKEYAVLLQPGYFYDFHSGPRLIVSLLSNSDDLTWGLTCLKQVVSEEK